MSLIASGSYGVPVRDADLLPQMVSDDAVIQLVGAAFARMTLDVGDARDVRLVAFVLDASSRLSGASVQKAQAIMQAAVVVDDHLASLAGLSNQRVERAVSRLLEAQVLERRTDDPPRWFRFSSEVIRPAGSDQY